MTGVNPQEIHLKWNIRKIGLKILKVEVLA